MKSSVRVGSGAHVMVLGMVCLCRVEDDDDDDDVLVASQSSVVDVDVPASSVENGGDWVMLQWKSHHSQ